MSGTIASQIAALQADITNLNAQILLNALNPSTVASLNAQITDDQNQIVQLQAELCFTHGVHILTERGEVRVEDLMVGDHVITPYAAQDSMPVRWIGRQRRVGERARCGQPVLVQIGALGDGLPHRALRVSGDHCLFLDGRLVPAKLLVNGVTILADAGHAEIDYINIELDLHTVVLAEGVESETYLDCGNRARFDNADEPSAWLASRPARDGSAWLDGTAFAPPLWDGPELDALRLRLLGPDLSRHDEAFADSMADAIAPHMMAETVRIETESC